MNRPLLLCALLVASTATLVAQSATQSNPYEGTSHPPADDTITTEAPPPPPPQAKPPAGHPVQQAAPSATQPVMAAQPPSQPASTDDEAIPPAAANTGSPADQDQGDDGVVQVAPAGAQPALNQRAYASDPDGDIVHPPLPPNTLVEGTMIRVRLLDRLSSASSEDGEVFHTIVGTDVLDGNGHVLIPAGSEIDGRVMNVSGGHAGGHGSMYLQPETVILQSGVRYRLYAQVTSTPGSNTHITGEGTVVPDSRFKRDGMEYGGAVGAGAVAGAVVGGPVGALTGTLVGAGLVTTHLLVNHPQATLDSGTVLMFSLTHPLTLVPDAGGSSGATAAPSNPVTN